MYELDDWKDQVMTVLKLAFANLAMWVRDNYFPPAYAHATWKSLVPFFRLTGRVVRGTESVHVELTTFNDRGLNRDLVGICDRVGRAGSGLQDYGTLRLSTENDREKASDARMRCVA